MLMCSEPDLEISEYADQIWDSGEVPRKFLGFLGLHTQF